MDDLLSVPFSPEELVARVLAVLRRTSHDGAALRPVLRLGELEIDILHRRVRAGTSELHLTALEQSLLYLLAANAGRLLTRDEILDHLWGVDYAAESNVVDRHVRNLRAKLQNGWRRPRYIATVPGRGYRFLPTDAGRRRGPGAPGPLTHLGGPPGHGQVPAGRRHPAGVDRAPVERVDLLLDAAVRADPRRAVDDRPRTRPVALAAAPLQPPDAPDAPDARPVPGPRRPPPAHRPAPPERGDSGAPPGPSASRHRSSAGPRRRRRSASSSPCPRSSPVVQRAAPERPAPAPAARWAGAARAGAPA